MEADACQEVTTSVTARSRGSMKSFVGHSGNQSQIPVKVSSSFGSLQALRAFAAILVVFYHVNHSFFSQSKYFVDRPFGSFFDFGHAGVQFFFVLSGFIIFSAHRRDIGDRTQFASFVWKRVRRVYPVYWIVLLFVAPMFLLVPSLGSGMERQPGVLLDSALLMHLAGSGSTIVLVSWTLFHEILFYAVFSLLIINRRLGTVALVAWFAGSVCAGNPDLNPHGFEFLFSSLHLLFGMGIAAAWYTRNRVCAFPAMTALLGAALFFGTGLEEVYGAHLPFDASSLLYGAGSSIAIVAAVELERQGRLRVPNVLLYLGNASYSIYLAHVLALSVLAKLAVMVEQHVAVPHAIIYLGLVAGATIAGIGLHEGVEKPVLSLLGQWRPQARRVVAPLPSTNLTA